MTNTSLIADRRAAALNESRRLRGLLTWHDLDHWFQSCHRTPGAEEAGNDRVGLRQFAEITGYSWRYVQTLRARQVIPPLTADAIAGRFQMHPTEIWPNWYEAAA